MKAIVILVTVAAVANFADVECRLTLAQMQNTLKSVRKVCVSKSGVAIDILDATQNGEFPPDKELQCYFKCLLTMMQAMKNGKIDLAAILKQADLMLPEDMMDGAKKLANTCHPQVTSEDECEAAWQFAKCNYETDKDIYFFP